MADSLTGSITDALGDVDRVVGETFVVAAEQSDVYRCGDAVWPVWVHHDREKLPMNDVHRVIGDGQLRRFVRILFEHYGLRVISYPKCDVSHLGEVPANVGGYGAQRMASVTDASDVGGQGRHAPQIGQALEAADCCAQIRPERRLTGEDGERVCFQGRTLVKDCGAAVDDTFGGIGVGVEEGLGGELHHRGGAVANDSNTTTQIVEPLIKDRPHRGLAYDLAEEFLRESTKFLPLDDQCSTTDAALRPVRRGRRARRVVALCDLR